MWPEIRIRVKMCGNCNPIYDSKKLLNNIQLKNSKIIYLFSDNDCYDIYIIINGCNVSCVKKPKLTCPIIYISGLNINDEQVKENELVDYIIQLIN